MQAKPNTKHPITIDRTTRLGILALAAAVVVLIILIALITYLPSETISRTISQQAREQQRLQSQSIAGQIEGLFNNLGNDLLALASRPAVRYGTKEAHSEALNLVNALGERRKADLNSIVLLDSDGRPIYAWPPAYDAKIQAGESLQWSADTAWLDRIKEAGGIQYERRTLLDGKIAYFLVYTLTPSTFTSQTLVFEINLQAYLKNSIGSVQLGNTGQLWIIDQRGLELYRSNLEQPFPGGTAQFLGLNSTQFFPAFPTAERETFVVPIYTAFTQNRSETSSLILVISHETEEGQQEVRSTLFKFFLFGLATIAFIVLFGVAIGRFLLREAGRRQKEEQRRSTARTLLDVSRALNSSLDINVVLQRILEELRKVITHDSASILMLDESGDKVSFVAETGEFTTESVRPAIPLEDIRGARAVLIDHKPIVINDCANDPRWSPQPGSNIQAWLGVPLRVREEAVGVLNINSFQVNRFDQDDIDLAEAFADQAGSAIQSARAHELEIQAYEAELATARAIQTSLLPQESPPIPQLDIAAVSIPARHVSGDYHQYFMLPDGKFGLAVGDVSGKGIPAALLMAVITTSLREEILRISAPGPLLNELNGRLLPRMQQNKMNSALLVCIFDPLTRHVEIANGGMVQPYLLDGSQWRQVEVGGYPLGASSRMQYMSKTVTLAPDSMLIFVSDGVVEAQNAAGDMYSFERLENLLVNISMSATAEQVAQQILDSLRAYLDNQEAQDDLTIVVMKSLEIERIGV